MLTTMEVYHMKHAEKLLKLLLDNKIYYPLVFSLVFENKKGRLKELLPPNDLWYKAHTIAKTLGYEFEPFYRNSYITCNYFKENSFNVSSDGKLYNCLSGVGMEAYYISDLKEYDTYRYYSRKSQFMLEDNHADCDTTCDLYSICVGGCMFRKKTSGFNCERQHMLNNEIELLKDLIPYE